MALKKREQDPALWQELFGECDPVMLEKFQRRFSKALYAEFVRRAVVKLEEGWTHYGAQTIIEAIRYDTHYRDRGGGMFKISNNFVAMYSRVLCFNDPTRFPPEFFGLRKQRGRVHGAD